MRIKEIKLRNPVRVETWEKACSKDVNEHMLAYVVVSHLHGLRNPNKNEGAYDDVKHYLKAIKKVDPERYKIVLDFVLQLFEVEKKHGHEFVRDKLFEQTMENLHNDVKRIEAMG